MNRQKLQMLSHSIQICATVFTLTVGMDVNEIWREQLFQCGNITLYQRITSLLLTLDNVMLQRV